jgi:hypothetical protein
VNWTKWSDSLSASIVEKSIQDRTNAQRDPKVRHERNKWWAVSMPPHPVAQKWKVWREYASCSQIWLCWQPITQRPPRKDRHLCRNQTMPNKVFSCPQSNYVLRGQHLIRISNWVTCRGIRQPPPPTIHCKVQWKVVENNYNIFLLMLKIDNHFFNNKMLYLFNNTNLLYTHHSKLHIPSTCHIVHNAYKNIDLSLTLLSLLPPNKITPLKMCYQQN